MVQLAASSLLNPRPNLIPVRRALLSVSDKSGILELARALHDLGITLLSTGGTAQALKEAGLPVTPVEDITHFPEMLDGRVKTLHPNVHGGLLARRDLPQHMQQLIEAGIEPIDLLVVNLYPFRQTLKKPGAAYQEVIENIDIGGPAMLRAAAKNHDGVAVVVDPRDYEALIAELRGGQSQLMFATRQRLAAKAFAHTAAYDGAISNFLNGLPALDASTQDPQHNTVLPQDPATASALPSTFSLQVHKHQDMRYGENPHQHAAFYRDSDAKDGCLSRYTQLQGKELSFNNIADADAAWLCVRSFAEPACVIVKHANPCGVAVAASPLEAYKRAFQTDPTSAFGGILAFNAELDETAARAIGQQFAEVIIAPAFSAAALKVFSEKQNLRLLRVPLGEDDAVFQGLDIKRVSGGLLLQTPDRNTLRAEDLRVVTERKPTPDQLADLLFAWKVATWVKSNAIVFCKDQMTMGVGAGQMSRLDSARIAAIKAGHAGLTLAGSVAASDAFFPFRDGLDVVADAGAVAVVQPGGSVRDDEVIAAANERGLAMVLTGMRHFRH
ncbi:MAG: bifunctional phosphoribosylaminoimidazolecarboxamide formyltransferase/IMP cyclohydrolase PurH [Betaproteobacteria bacterium]|nr:bifunctional phosphoribosylaminoimidazolecarboxamide formyltransferase/IMP cyclohydrolase PurH [Betaproteobacteria bacterium]